jgi:molybdopterin biosynthesis enzyme
MIDYADARALVLATAKALPAESIPLSQALGRTLARDIKAREAIPPFTKATMDGYAYGRGHARAVCRRLSAVVSKTARGRLPKDCRSGPLSAS